MGMDGVMINDMMAIVPVRVWVFWIFVILFLTIYCGYKAYSNLMKDNVKLAKMIMESKN